MPKADLYTTIREYGKQALPFHMPGHKRNTVLLGCDLPYDGDITEIDGFGDLHGPEKDGILFSLSCRAAALYGAKSAFPLVSGSTGGLLSAIRALSEPSGSILIARNCHKSVYHAVELCGLRHISLLPPTDAESGVYGSIRSEDVEAALSAHPEIRTVVITSPTYEGVVSDIPSIADAVHRHHARLIVDGAHGAHFGFHAAFPAFPKEADVVVTSLHKTLPSLTQTALALVFSLDAAVSSALQREITVFETSSPSYILLASIDRCISLLEKHAVPLFSNYAMRLEHFRAQCTSLRTFTLLTGDSAHPDFYAFDSGKLVISSRTLNGTALADRLRREFRIEPEMAYDDYILCMTSICDETSSFDRLFYALSEIDQSQCASAPSRSSRRAAVLQALPEMRLTISEAIRLPECALRAGEVSRVYAWVYPPGVPLLVPGEVISSDTLVLLRRLEETGLKVRIGR